MIRRLRRDLVRSGRAWAEQSGAVVRAAALPGPCGVPWHAVGLHRPGAEVSIENNTLRIHRVVCAIDCDRIVNPDTIAAQMEAASTMACRPRYMARSRSRVAWSARRNSTTTRSCACRTRRCSRRSSRRARSRRVGSASHRHQRHVRGEDASRQRPVDRRARVTGRARSRTSTGAPLVSRADRARGSRRSTRNTQRPCDASPPTSPRA